MNINRAFIHTSTWSGPWNSAQNGDVTITQLSNNITLVVNAVEADSDVPGPIVLDTPLITRARPDTEVWDQIPVKDDAVPSTETSTGTVKIGTDGVVTIYADQNMGDFVGGGKPTGFPRFSLSYTAAIVNGFDNQV